MAIYPFEVGTLKCAVLSEVSNPIPYDEQFAQAMANASFEQVRAALDDLGEGKMGERTMNCLLIDDGNTKLLVDTGLGNPEHSGLLTALSEAGVSPDEIDIVYLTHFHGDHIGGMTNAEGQPTFPNARYVTMRQEWDYWTSPATFKAIGDDRAGLTQKKLLPFEGKFTLLAHGGSIMGGVQIMAAPGHSPGHSGLLVNSLGQRLLVLGDALTRMPQVARPDFHFVYDADKNQAVLTREAMLELAADEALLTHFYHLPFPGLGHITRAGKGFRWQAVK